MHGLMGGGWKRGATTVDAKDPGGETPGVSAKTYRRATPPRQSSTLHGRFYKSQMISFLERTINGHLVRWACRKYKPLHRYKAKARTRLALIASNSPELFVHWRHGALPSGSTRGAV